MIYIIAGVVAAQIALGLCVCHYRRAYNREAEENVWLRWWLMQNGWITERDGDVTRVRMLEGGGE